MVAEPNRVKEIFLAATEQPDEAARVAYLDRACGGDAALRERVEALLRVHDPDGSFLGTPAASVPDPGEAGTMAFADTPDREASPTSTAEALSFLAPSTRPGSLGRLGHYEVLQVLGKGGFGIVFRALDDVLQRVVALKVLAPQMAATSPARKRFLREARSSAQVRHENVVQVYEVAEEPLPYLAMEFIPGESLQQRLDRTGPLDVAETLRIGRQIAEGLAAAHDHDLIHRDIKPGNVLLESGPRGHAKITDFGLARAADDASISQSGIIAGTPMYMAPEQAKGEPLNQRADLFSLGSVLYQMVTGRAPFRANAMLAVLKRVAEDRPRAIREIIPETPQWLCDVIAKLHAKNPDDRYQTAREVADVLADCEVQLKAHSKLKDFSRIPREKPASSGKGKWLAAAAVLLLPVIALAVTELAGVTNLFRGRQPTPNPIKPGVVAKEEPQPAFKNSMGMEFVKVPKGKSWLGGGKDRLGEQEVEIAADFYLGKYEVTQEEWEKVMGENPSHFSRTGGGKDAVKDILDADLKRFPVEKVSWDQCQIFVAKLNQREKESGWVFRLPTEMEWEYACRGGPLADRMDSAFDYYFAKPTNTLLPEQANIGNDEGLNRPCKVGSYQPNPLGLHDMHGNAFEWCDDGRSVGSKCLKGGSWASTKSTAMSAAFPGAAVTGGRFNSIGLRLARVPTSTTSREPKTPPLAVAPFTDADVRRVAALPAAEQIEEVRKELMRRNPGFDGTVGHKIEEDKVTELRIVTDKVTDISPIRVFNSLRTLDLSGTQVNFVGNGQLADLSPLIGMNLAGLGRLHLNWTMVGDEGLVHFKDCKILTFLALDTTQVSDTGLAYFKDNTDLTYLNLNRLKISDAGLAHFKNCKNLKFLHLGVTPVSDAGLSYFKECEHLTVLGLSRTRVTDAGLAHFKDCKKLANLALVATQVTDVGLAHFKDFKELTRLHIGFTKVTDLSLIKGMPLKELDCTFRSERDAEILRSIKTLEKINGKPADQFWKDAGAGQAEFKEWLKLVPTLTAEQQVAAVVARLKERNPGLDGKAGHKIEGGVVTELSFIPVKGQNVVADLSPVRALAGLTNLNLWGCGGLEDLEPLKGLKLTRLIIGSFHVNHQVRDLEPLKGMKLTELSLYHCQVRDLEPLKDMPLTRLTLLSRQVRSCEPLKGMPLNVLNLSNCTQIQDFMPLGDLPLTGLHLNDCKVRDLEPFKGMKLTRLALAGTPVRDLELLKGMPLKDLSLHRTGVTDLKPLQGMGLEEIYLTPKNITQGLDILRDMKSLNKIGLDYYQVWQPKEFWERYDKGEFK